MINKILACLAVVAVALSAQNSSLYPDVKLLQSDDRGITVEFRPRYSDNKKIVSGSTVFQLPQFAFSSAAPLNRPGQEDIRTRVLSVAFPTSRGNSVTVIAADFETITGFSLAPVPFIEPTDSYGTIKRSYKTEYLSKDRFFPEQIAEVRDIAAVRGILAGNLIIAPYQFQSSSGTLKRYSRIVVRIDFGPQTTAFVPTGNDAWAQASILNFTAAKKWTAFQRPAKITAVNSNLSSGTWVKVEVAEDGMYKIDAAYLRAVGIDPSAQSITDVKIFGADGRVIPENLSAPRPADLPLVPVEYVDKDKDGVFDAEDYILFYGQGVTGWNYASSVKLFTHYGNPYTFSNYYFICAGGAASAKSMDSVRITTATTGSLHRTPGKVFFDEDKFNFDQSGQEWVSSPLNPGESRTVSTRLFGRVPGTPVTYRYLVYARAAESTTMSVDESGQALQTAAFGIVDFDTYYYFAYPVELLRTITPSLVDAYQRSNVKFKYNSASNISTAYIGWLRIFYTQQLTATNNMLTFYSPDTTGVVEFDADGFSSNDVAVYEISKPNATRKILYQLQQQSGALTFKDTLSIGSIHRYWIGTPDQYKTPKSFVKLPNSNLHANNGAEFIIISHNDFKSEANRLKQHKESLPGNRKLSTVVVDVDTIFNEFGIGMPDPTAIRDFLRYAVEHWSVRPNYVLFFGDASYDYRSILNNDRSWVPTYQTPESNIKISTYSVEDYFSYLDPAASTTVTIAHGRLAPRTNADAKLLVDKIIHYETTLPKGQWKNMITLVADDLWTPTSTEIEHTQQTEVLAGIAMSKDFDITRIYAEEYPTVFTSSGRRKPEVRKAILDQVNGKGTVLLNYVGHGNPKVWAHESILTLDDTRSQFVNREKLPFIVAATCDWGRFEEAGEPSSAEEVLLNKNGGAIGVLSATRAVYSSENALTNQRFYNYLFSGKPTLRFGDAYMLMKNSLSEITYLENKQKYFLLGDPTLSLAAPSGKIVVDSLLTASGAQTDTLRALEKITIKGTVRDSANAVVTGYNGTALVSIFDAERRVSIASMGGWTYDENGALIYNGEASITNGSVTASFIVPKDISYTNLNGRITLYFSNADADGRGYDRSFIVGGSNANAVPDSIGPEISIFLDNTNFRSGDVVTEHPKLFVALKDSSGINSSTNSIGHRLEAWIDGNAKSIDLTEYYKGTIDSYQEGAAEYVLENLSQGNHSIKVRAWDVHNNSSTAESFFIVAASNTLSIQHLYNFPNPVTTSTAFTFQHNQSLPIDVTITIYTVAGREIHKIERRALPDRFVKIDWNRVDSDGSEVGNGVYFYKVNATTIDGRFTSEAIGKMAIVR
ncbi:MAG: type IX secretion system sortase PorU [Bacteroidota bacterium]